MQGSVIARCRSPAPETHGIEVFRELDEVGGLFFVLLLHPEEQLGGLQLPKVLRVQHGYLLRQVGRLEVQE